MIACLKARQPGTVGAERSIRPARSCELRRALVQPHGLASGAVHRLVDGPRYSTARTWAQTTIIPMNKVIDASAAASSTTARIMMRPPFFEHIGNIVHDTFRVNRRNRRLVACS